MNENPEGRYYCEICRRRYDDPGDCPRCPEEPLLDLGDEDVRLMLQENDLASRNRRFATIFMVSALVVAPFGVVLWIYISACLAIPLCALGVFLSTTVLTLVFPARKTMPPLTVNEIYNLSSMARNAP